MTPSLVILCQDLPKLPLTYYNRLNYLTYLNVVEVLPTYLVLILCCVFSLRLFSSQTPVID